MRKYVALFLLAGVVALPFLLAAERGRNEAPGGRIAAFSSKDINGQEVSLAGFKDKKAIVMVFIGTECPVNNYYMRRLLELHGEFDSKGVQFVAVNSNIHDPAERVAEHAKEHRLPFPVIKDGGNKIADQFSAERTPEAFILDPQGNIRYHGRIDDQYGVGYQRPKPTRRDLAEALTELLAGKTVSVARTEVAGCIIGREKNSDKTARATEGITYTKQIARILQNNCQECHRPGQIGPFSLMTYEKARGWADSIREIVDSGRMPPWHADPRYGKFANTRGLSKTDKEALMAWIDQGCPKGDEKDLPPPRSFVGADGWSMGKPDVVFQMDREFTVPATTPKRGIRYQYFFVNTEFEKDMWIQAAEAKAGNRAVVHHIIVFSQKPGTPRREGDDRLGNGFLCATAPGDLPLILPPGTARKLPKNAILAFQMHYTPNGVEQTDRSSVGLIFAKEPPKHEVKTRAIMQQRFAIPAGASNHEVSSSTTFRKDAVILSLMPHMHLRGKAFQYKAVFPDGREEILLSVPRYDFNWQTYYHLATPLRLPAGTRIVCTAHFDNSENNLSNPDPTKTVFWGEQTWEEMMIGFCDYYYVDQKPGDPDPEEMRADNRSSSSDIWRLISRRLFGNAPPKPESRSPAK